MPRKGESKLSNTNVIQEYLNGKTTYELGEKYGVNRVTVGIYLKKQGVELRSSKDDMYADS